MGGLGGLALRSVGDATAGRQDGAEQWQRKADGEDRGHRFAGDLLRVHCTNHVARHDNSLAGPRSAFGDCPEQPQDGKLSVAAQWGLDGG